MIGTLYSLENLITSKEDKTKISFTSIANVNVDNLRHSGFYISESWDNNIQGLPSELGAGNKAFYLQVFSRTSNDYTTQVLYSFKGLIFIRSVTGSNNIFSSWRRI